MGGGADGAVGLQFFLCFIRFVSTFIRGVAQPGSALRSGRRGRWFESSRPDLAIDYQVVSGFFLSWVFAFGIFSDTNSYTTFDTIIEI